MGVEDRVVCVAGAAGQLGAVVTGMAVRAGARLVLLGQNPERLNALRSTLCLKESHCLAFSVDAGDFSALRDIMDEVVRQFGQIDVLFNTVGGYEGATPAWETSEEVWLHMWRLNMVSCVNLSRAVLPHMLANKWGRIVNIGAKAVLEPRKNGAAYAAAKAAVVAFTQTVAVELKSTGVTANVILPSIIDSPTNRQMMPNADPDRWVRPAQIAATMLFLCSDEAIAINGAAIPIYGQV